MLYRDALLFPALEKNEIPCQRYRNGSKSRATRRQSAQRRAEGGVMDACVQVHSWRLSLPKASSIKFNFLKNLHEYRHFYRANKKEKKTTICTLTNTHSRIYVQVSLSSKLHNTFLISFSFFTPQL